MEAIQALIVGPFMEMVTKVKYFVPTLVSAIVVLIIGLLIAKLLRDAFGKVFKELHLDKLSDKIGLSGLLHKGGIKAKLSGLISDLVYLIVVITFLMVALKVVGLTAMYALLDHVIGYIPQVLSAVFVLVLGMIVAKIIASIVYAVAMNLAMPEPKIYHHVTHWAIVIYAIKVSVEELGFGFLFVGTVFHIWFAGVVLALALSYGLSGKLIHKKGK